MTISLEHLPLLRQQQLQAVTKIITMAIHPEKIILFGVYATPGASPVLSPEQQFPSFLYGYDILVVTRRNDQRCDHALQDIIENRCRFSTPVNILVHDIGYVNDQLSRGHYFFSTISREAILLYDAGLVPLVDGPLPDPALIRAAAQRDFERWWSRASAFYNTAVFSRQQKEWRISIFLLHQAVEQTYQAILLVFTGYKPCTHNLDKLRRYTNRLSIELALVFPRNTAEEDRLFRLLLQGYVDARYKEDYCITEEDIVLLTERVARLQSVAVRVCRNRFISLDKMRSAA
ncbi:MAG TPA: HEPN domain-containing protein [Puia sp.]|nr:HEPN domain-containing protein [Puia sp.]